MTITFKALSALLSYPTDDLVAALPEVRAIVIDEASLGAREREALVALVNRLAATDPLDAQEAYVELFDRGRSTSLHLFEHVHGDSRDRGPAMVDLDGIYRNAGYQLTGGELPDYLPALLEYLATRPAEEIGEMLGDCAHIVRRIGEALVKRGSDYSAVLAAVLALAGEPGLGQCRDRAAAIDKPLDDEWIEEPVIFGPAAACGSGCGTPPPRPASIQFIPRRA